MDPELLTLDRLPLPSLKVYTYLSVLAASFSFYYIGTESGAALQQLSLQNHQNGHCTKFNITSLPTNYEDLLLERGGGGGGGGGAHSVIVQSDSELKTANSLGGLVAASYHWWTDDKNDNFNDSSHHDDHHDQQMKNVTESDCINERNQQLTWQLFQWATQQPHCVWVSNISKKLHSYFIFMRKYIFCGYIFKLLNFPSLFMDLFLKIFFFLKT